jgi:hypothetical protein
LDDGGEKFVSLRRQIRETTISLQELADSGKEGTKEFKQLSDKLDELQDAQKRVAFQSAQIEDKLAALPGPIGSIGKGFAAAKESVETFGTGLAVATGGITLIIGAVLAMKEAMGKTKEGQEALNKVSQAFSKILAPIFAILEKYGIPLFEKFAEMVEWVASKIAKFASYLGISEAKVKEVYTNIDEVGKKQAEEEKKRQDDLAKKAEEAAEKKKKAHEAWVAKQKELEQERLENEKWALAQELKQFEEQQAKIKKLKASGALEPIGLDGLTAKEREAALKAEEERKKYFAAKQQKLVDDLNKKIADGTIKVGASTALLVEAQARNTAQKVSKVDQWLNSEKKKRLDENLMATKAALNIAGGLVDEGSNAAKAIAVAQTTIDTYQSATAAYKSLVGIPIVGPALGIAAAAAAIAAGIANVNKIVSTKVPKMSTGGADSSSGEGANISAPSITAPTLPSMAFNDSTLGLGGANPTAQIAQTLAQTTGKPIKAYVVSTEMSSHQALDRRTNVAATF